MATKYLYIDDDPNAHGIVKSIETEDLKFDVKPPTNWNEQIEILLDNQILNNYDGLLLDLKLEFTEQEGENSHKDEKSEDVDKSKLIKFSGADLAQRIRTSAKAKKIKDLPVFLCSTDNNFMSFYDKTSHDLFDKKFNKNEDFKSSNHTTKIFIEYANAYKYLLKSTKINNFFENNSNEEDEDLNILKLELEKCNTPHEIVYLIDRFFIQKDGIIVDEETLAIKLGIDIKKSPDWERFLKNEMSIFKYKGILAKVYPRWWIYDIISSFKTKCNINLKILDSSDRVKLIKEKYIDYDLNCLESLENQEFSTYWYKCVISRLPLDLLDGLKIIEIPRYPWIDQGYISKHYMLSDERDKELINSYLGPNEKRIFNELDL